GAEYQGRKVGTLAKMTVFSFHPVKHITTGEGGMIVTQDAASAEFMRRFRNHGIRSDHHQRAQQGTWYYEMVDLGYNYRITDLQCALGLSQLRKLPGWLERRRAIAEYYDAAFNDFEGVQPLRKSPSVRSAYHLYVLRLRHPSLIAKRPEIFAELRADGIGVNVHYSPVYLHPYYRQRFGFKRGLCPRAEEAYEQILSLPIFPGLSDAEIERVAERTQSVLTRFLS
ncbi:MAG: DegT/DnrJ/EryC1/StrS family aminotransferase, partial [bacterium]